MYFHEIGSCLTPYFLEFDANTISFRNSYSRRYVHKTFLRVGLFCFLLALSANRSLWAETLVLATSDNAPIFDARASNPGFLNVLFKELSKRLDIDLQLEKMPSERGLYSANGGILDGDANRVSGLTRLYPNLVEIPEPVMNMDFVAFGQTGHSGWESLYGRKVGIIRGWKIAERRLKDQASLVSVREPTQLMELLRRQRVDAIVYEKYQGLLLMSQLRWRDKLTWYPLETRVMHIYLNERNSNWVDPINDVLVKMKQDGSYQRIADRTLHQHQEAKLLETVKNDAR